HGHLGDKTPMLGGFFRKYREQGRAVSEALDPASGQYRPVDPDLKVPFVEEVRDLHRRGRYREGIAHFMEAEGEQADVARQVVLGYVSYGLNRAGADEVVERYEDIDRIMSAGFNWAPPSALVDLIDAQRTRELMERYGLPVPALVQAAAKGEVATPL